MNLDGRVVPNGPAQSGEVCAASARSRKLGREGLSEPGVGVSGKTPGTSTVIAPRRILMLENPHVLIS